MYQCTHSAFFYNTLSRWCIYVSREIEPKFLAFNLPCLLFSSFVLLRWSYGIVLWEIFTYGERILAQISALVVSLYNSLCM